jgi:hypothetical protein
MEAPLPPKRLARTPTGHSNNALFPLPTMGPPHPTAVPTCGWLHIHPCHVCVHVTSQVDISTQRLFSSTEHGHAHKDVGACNLVVATEPSSLHVPKHGGGGAEWVCKPQLGTRLWTEGSAHASHACPII